MDLDRAGPILCFGEILLRLSAPAGTRLANAREFAIHVGGAEANAGAVLAALGRDVEIVTALPVGALGDLCAAELRRAGMGVRFIARGEGRLGTYFLEHGVGARAASIVYDRSGSLFAGSADGFDWQALTAAASWLHLSGINLPVSRQSSDGSLAAVEAMRAAGGPVSFDVNHRASMWNGRTAEAAAVERKVMERTTLLFASGGDICRALGREIPEATTDGRRGAAQAAFDAFPSVEMVVSTRRETGSDGSPCLTVRIDDRETAHETDPTPIGPVIDRIGTGDAMAGAIIDAVLRKAAIQDVARIGLAAAILKHGMSGDQWLGSAAELEAFHASRHGDVLR